MDKSCEVSRKGHNNAESVLTTEDARKSAGHEERVVENGGEGNDDEDENDEDPLLGDEQARLYRGVAARLNYIAPDRPDIGFAVKESARSMSAPRESDMRKIKKIGRYLRGVPRVVCRFPWQRLPSRLTTFTDSDWAGCHKSARSTSGGVVCLGEHVIKSYCKQQKVVALSSAEAELYAMVAASAETLAVSHTPPISELTWRTTCTPTARRLWASLRGRALARSGI